MEAEPEEEESVSSEKEKKNIFHKKKTKKKKKNKRGKGTKKKSWGRPITRTGEKQLNWRCREAANHAAEDRERGGRAAGQTTSLSSSAIAFSWSWNYAVKSHTHRHTQTHNLYEKVIFCRFFGESAGATVWLPSILLCISESECDGAPSPTFKDTGTE